MSSTYDPLLPETRNPILETDTRNSKPIPETRYPKPETRYLKPDSRTPTPETRNPKPELRYPKPDTRNPIPDRRYPRRETLPVLRLRREGENGPLRVVHLSRHKLPGGLVNRPEGVAGGVGWGAGAAPVRQAGFGTHRPASGPTTPPQD